MKFTIKYLFILFVSVLYSAIFAQDKPYALPTDKKLDEMLVERYTIANGLPTNTLSGIYQGKDGYLWLASFDGIIRFDGLRFYVFNKVNTPVFTENSFYNITGDNKGRIYFLSNKEIFLYENGHFEKIFEEKYKLEPILSIDSKGRIWGAILQKGAFYIWNKKKTMVLADTVSKSKIFISSDLSGKTYISIDDRLYQFSNQILTRLIFPVENIDIHKTATDNDNLLYVPTTKGCYTFDGESFKKVPLLENNEIWYIFPTQNSIWINSVSRLFRKTGYRIDEISQDLLDRANINFLEDAEGNAWIISDRKGLISLKKPMVTYYPTKFVVNAIYPDNNKIVVAGDNGQMKQLENNKLHNVSFESHLTEKRIRHITKDNRQQWWISAYKDLVKFDLNGKKTIYFPDKFVRLTFQDSKNRIWVTFVDKSLYVLEPGQTIFKPINLASSSILSISEDHEGNLWMGTAGEGIFVLDDMKILNHYTIKNGLISNTIFNSYIDAENTVWLSCNDGLSRIKSGKITNYTTQNGLVSNQVYDVLEDDSGNFFMPFVKGIMKISRTKMNDFAEGKIKEIEPKVFDSEDGIVTEGLTPVSHPAKGTDGKMYFPATDGVFMIDPKALSFNTIPPQVHIESFLVDNEEMNRHKPIETEAGKKDFKFKFTAICFYAPKNVKFRYKLEGFDAQWSETDYQTREVTRNLSAGNYTFRVTACNSDGVWNNEGDSISFVVKPFWYETWVFKISAFLLTILAIIFFYKLRTKKLRDQKLDLEQIVKVRTAEIVGQKEEIQAKAERLEELDQFKEGMTGMIVHDLKNPLNSILNNDNIDRIKQAGKQMLNMVMNILDVQKFEDAKMKLELKNRSAYNIVENAYDQVKMLINEKNIVFENQIEPRLGIKTDTEILERVFVNLLTNATKYTPNNGSITVSNLEGFEKPEGLARINVSDTGLGIPADKLHLVFEKFGQVKAKKLGGIRSTGLGLTFCKLAIEAHGGKIGVESELNKGTTFWFTIPLGDDVENRAITEIEEYHDKTFQLSASDKQVLLRLFPLFKELEVYEVSHVRNLLRTIDMTDKPALSHWAGEMQNALRTGNEEKYAELVSQIES